LKTRDVIGGAELLAKQSDVDALGQLRIEPIDGVIFRPTRPVPHDDGHVTEVARASWSELTNPVVQVHITTTLPGRIRAWGLHPLGTDRLFVASGLVRIVVFDGREDSATKGRLNVFTVSEKNPGLLIVPPCLYHGWKNIGVSEACIINMPDRMYDYATPDALDLPWDSASAQSLIPHRWG
jgi:dTDP-4-dehydrorhamnose 3,5-epimerase